MLLLQFEVFKREGRYLIPPENRTDELFMSDWNNTGKPVILASGSPRRKEILSMMGFSFKVILPQWFDEKDYICYSDLENSLQALAIKKAQTVSEKYPDALVLSADTVVVKDKEIFGKPSDKSDAYNMIKKLSGSSHQVLTAVSLRCEGKKFCESSVSVTNVYFRQLTDSEINEYLLIDEYKDKAGAYAIQGKSLVFVDKIEGCYYNVVGLPVSDTINLFRKFIVRKESADV